MRLATVIGLIVVVGCGGGNGDTESTEPVVTIEPSVVATTSSTTSSSTSTTLPPTTTTLPPTTSTTENASLQRQPLLDEAAAAGWGEYEDPLGWSIWMPADWSVESTEAGTAIITAPESAVIGVLAFDDTDGVVDSEDYLIRSLIEEAASGFLTTIKFSADDIILDVNQDAIEGRYDIWGIPVVYQDGAPGWAYAYHDPNTTSDLGYFFNVIELIAAGADLQETAEAVLLTFEPAGGY